MTNLDIEGVLRDHAMIWGDIGMHGYECVCGITDEDDRRWTESDYYAHVAAVLHEQIAAWLDSEAVEREIVQQANAEDDKHFAAGSSHGLGAGEAVSLTLAALAALVAPSRVPGEES